MTSIQEIELERTLYRGWWGDGLLDVLAGTALVLVGLGWHFDQAVLGAIGPAMMVPLWAPLRRKLIEPRTGYVEFSGNVRQRERKGTWLLLATGCGALVLGVAVFVFTSDGGGVPGRTFVAGLPAILLGVAAGLVGGLLRLPRFGVYAAVLLVLGALTVALGLHPAPAMLASGATVLACGAVLLANFLHCYPVAAPESDE